MAVHQLLATAHPDDPATAAALADRAVLGRLGPSEVFAAAVHPDLASSVRLLRDLDGRAGRGGDDVLVVHVSSGAPDLARFLDGRRERAVLRYHGLPPAGAYAEVDPHEATRLGRAHAVLPALARRCGLAVAPSASTAAELAAAGAGRVVVVPPALEVTPAPGGSPAPGGPPVAGEGPLVLLVGDLAPFRRQHALVDAFHVLATYLRTDAHLLLAGRAATPRYARLVAHHAARLVLRPVSVTEAASPAERAACYRRADVFASLSAYEGFCGPAVEAMAFGVPVVARRTPGLADTAGGAALLLDDPSPELTAEALHAVLGDAGLRAGLVGRGRRRAEEVGARPQGGALLDALESYR